MKTQLLLHIVVIAGLLSCTSPKSPEELADVIYTTGKIYTVNDAQPWAEAVAIKDGKFLIVGWPY